MKKQVKIITMLLAVTFAVAQAAFAEPLVYQGNSSQNPLTGTANVQSANTQTRAVPVTYNTNYENQYSQFSSFMSSPYTQGGMMQQYTPAAPGMMGQGQGAGANNDPLQASEISPYSKYSPYIEIVGEGSNYTLGIDDVITVIVRNQPDFSGRFIVDPEGNIQYNFVGDIPAIGKTKEELKQDIMQRLKKFVRYPEVAVMISEYRSKAVYVFGYVNAPGKYAMKGDTITLKEVIVAAGLPRMDAAANRVYVVRPTENTKTGKAEKKKVDVNKILNKGESAEDFLLQPGDTVIVNQRYYDKFVNNFTRLIGPLFQAAAVYDLGFGSPENGFFGGKKD